MIAQYSREAIKKGPKRIPMDMMMISIMEQMHWSYDEYMNTPERIINLIIEKANIDFKVSKHGG